MPLAETLPTEPSPYPHRARAAVVSLLMFLAVFVTTVLASSGVTWFHDPTRPGGGGSPLLNDLGALAALGAVLLTLSVFWRRRSPWLVYAIGAFIALVLQFDMLLMLLGMSDIVARRDRRQWRLAAVGAAVVALIVIVRNATLHNWTELVRVTGPSAFLFHLLIVGFAYVAAFGLGWLRRSRRDLDRAGARVEEVEQHAEGLARQLTQQQERELLAREIHDALAHRLSLVSLHSGALETAARSGDGSVAEAAQVVRDNAHRSLEDLRDLIGALRESRPAGPVEEPRQVALHGMADVADVIDSTVAAGVTVNAFVMLCDPADASELLNRAVFRIVQESLTNVVKHAPGTTVGLDLRAARLTGVTLRIRNRLTTGSAAVPGSGTGLIGMRERVGALDGKFSAGPTDDGWFEVSVQLPWRSAVSD